MASHLLFIGYFLTQISLFSFHSNVQQPVSDCLFVSVMAGLLALLLIVLEWTRPSLPSPLRPICDLRVLNHFIKEARDAEAAMVRGKYVCIHSDRRASEAYYRDILVLKFPVLYAYVL